MARLKGEYGVEASAEPLNFGLARWVECADPKILQEFEKKNRFNLAHDAEGRLSYLAEGEWRLSHTQELFPEVVFLKTREST